MRKSPGENALDTKRQSFELFKKGISIDQIAQQRNLHTTTIEGHLAHYIEFGEIEVTQFVAAEKIRIIEEAIRQRGNEKLTPLKEALGEGYSFGEIRAVIAHMNFTGGKRDLVS